jgi:pimeloyl-ACP methyl ester carboxylesterase
MTVRTVTAARPFFAGSAAIARAQLRPVILPGTSAAGQPWQPRLQLFELVAGSRRSQAASALHPRCHVPGRKFDLFQTRRRLVGRRLEQRWFLRLGARLCRFRSLGELSRNVCRRAPAGEPLGRVPVAVKQLERAVRAIVAKSGAAKVSIVAHSWGTMAAGRFAGDHPELVDRLVFFSPIVRREALKGVPPLDTWRFLTVEAQKKRFIRGCAARRVGPPRRK